MIAEIKHNADFPAGFVRIIAVPVQRLHNAEPRGRTHGGFIVQNPVKGHDADPQFPRDLFEIDQACFVFPSHRTVPFPESIRAFHQKAIPGQKKKTGFFVKRITCGLCKIRSRLYIPSEQRK